MTFIKRDKGRGSDDLFSVYSHYLPGFGGMMMLLVMFLSGAILGNILLLVIGTICPPEFISLYGTVISYPVMFIPPMLYASFQSRKAELMNIGEDKGIALDSSRFGTFGGALSALVVSAITIGIAFMSDVLTSLMPPMPEWLAQALEQATNNGSIWVSLVSVSVFAPFFEEWLCRGMVLRGLLTRLKPWAAIMVSATFFAVIHMNPWQALPAFIMGVAFGYVYYKTGSLKLTMLMHCVNNTSAVIASRIPAWKDAESFLDIMNPWAYAGVFLLCAVVTAAGFMLLSRIPSSAAQTE